MDYSTLSGDLAGFQQGTSTPTYNLDFQMVGASPAFQQGVEAVSQRPEKNLSVTGYAAGPEFAKAVSFENVSSTYLGALQHESGRMYQTTGHTLPQRSENGVGITH